MSPTLYDGGQVGGVRRHAARRVFAVARVHLAPSPAAALGRAAAAAPRHAVTPQVGAAVDARDVEQGDAFKRRTAAQVQRAAVALVHTHNKPPDLSSDRNQSLKLPLHRLFHLVLIEFC